MSKRMALGNVAPVIARGNKAPADNLTLDSIAAQRAGMSYGKYKALHPDTYEARDAAGAFKKKKPAQQQGYDLICARCGSRFTGKSKDRRYCGGVCRQAANNEKYRARQKAKKEVPANELIV